MVGVAQHIEIHPANGPFAIEGVQFSQNPHWDRAKNEIVYARTKLGTNFDHKGYFTLFVAIQDKEATSSESAIAVLNAMLGEAERVIAAIEAECRRLDLIK
jgi:hypothetical protein